MIKNSTTFELRANGNAEEIALDTIFKGDITKGLDDKNKAWTTIEAVELKALKALADAYPVGGDGLILSVIQEGSSENAVLDPSNQSSALTSVFDTLVYGMYDHPYTDVLIHFRKTFDMECFEDNKVGYINKSHTTGIEWLGCRQPRFNTNYTWLKVGYRNRNFYLTSLDRVYFGRNPGDVARFARNAQTKHDYIDYLLGKGNMNINISVNRVYAIGFLYQLALPEELGLVVRGHHIEKAIAQRKEYNIMNPHRRIGTPPPAPVDSDTKNGPVPTVVLRDYRNPRKNIVLNEDNVGKHVLHYERGRKISRGSGTLWDGSNAVAESLSQLNSVSVRHGFELI